MGRCNPNKNICGIQNGLMNPFFQGYRNISGGGSGGLTLPDNFVPLILSIGQSNEVGQAEAQRLIQLTPYPEIPSLVEIYYKPSYSANDDGAFSIYQAGGFATKEPDQLSGFTWHGSNAILAHNIVAQIGRKCYIVMAARGGTSLAATGAADDWAPATSNECFTRATQWYYPVAYSKLQTLYPGQAIVPIICWHQGEYDAGDNTQTANYAANFSAFVTALRASHSSLANALMFITKLNFNQTANETTINGIFDTYAAANSSLVKVIDISDQPRKIDLSTAQKGGISPSGTGGADNNHQSYLAQIAKGERQYTQFVSYYNSTAWSEKTSNVAFNPSSIVNSGVRLQLNRDNVTIGSNYDVSGVVNNLNAGTFSISGNNPKFKINKGKGCVSFLAATTPRIVSDAAIGTSLFSGSFSISAWIKPRDGQPSANTYILHDIRSTGSPTLSRIAVLLTTAGKIQTFISIGSTVTATTASAVFANGLQSDEVHLAITYTSGDIIRIYINGVLQTLDATDSGNISGLTLANYVNGTLSLTVGAARTGASTWSLPWAGLLREVTVQKTVYSTTDIANLMLN